MSDAGFRGLAMKKTAFALIVMILTTGCSTEPPGSKSLAIVELVYRDRTEVVFLPGDYGFLIYWPDNGEAQLYLYDRPANRIQMTSDFSEFMAGLWKFPNDAKVDRMRGCWITAGGMGPERERELQQTIKAKGFRFEDGPFGICSCETIARRVFTRAAIPTGKWQSY